jgi:two-component system, cell cycle sensor histidine kinase and response regulator CckA
VAVDSVLGEGSTFRVTLPLAATAPADDLRISDVVPVVPLSRRRVLLVDDNDAVRTTTRRLLVRAGWVVDEAEDGEVAWERLAAAPSAYDIVLSDVRMPRLDGVRLVERMRRNQCQLPVVFMSGFDHIEYPFHHEVADVPLLPKPFTAETLTAILTRTLAATCHNP